MLICVFLCIYLGSYVILRVFTLLHHIFFLKYSSLKKYIMREKTGEELLENRIKTVMMAVKKI